MKAMKDFLEYFEVSQTKVLKVFDLILIFIGSFGTINTFLTSGFLRFSGGMEVEYWLKMG